MNPKFLEYFRMALALNGVQVDTPTADLICETYRAVYDKGGLFSVENAAAINDTIKSKYQLKEKTDETQK